MNLDVIGHAFSSMKWACLLHACLWLASQLAVMQQLSGTWCASLQHACVNTSAVLSEHALGWAH